MYCYTSLLGWLGPVVDNIYNGNILDTVCVEPGLALGEVFR